MDLRNPMARWHRRVHVGTTLASGVVLLAFAGCRVAESTARLPGQMANAIAPGSKPRQPDPAALQTEIFRYADEFTTRTAAGLNEFARRAGTPEARTQALTWKLSLDTSALAIASGPNPTANLLDLLSLTTMMHAFVESQATRTAPAGALDSWLESCQVLESNAWQLVETTFPATQLTELRSVLQQNNVTDAGGGVEFFERPQQFAALIREAAEKSAGPGSVFALVGLDPTAGLDPAVREVTRSRLFAERAMYIFQRMPFLIRWHVELMSDQVLRQDSIAGALDNFGRLGRAAESASQTAAQLPDRLTAERKAILDALEQQEGKLRELSAEVARTLAAGERMSTSLNTTLVTFDGLMKRFGVGEPSLTPPATNATPFNILDYAQTAEQIALMAQQLDQLLKDTGATMDAPALAKRLADVREVSRQAKSDAQAVLNHAFLLAAGLILLMSALAIAYRRSGTRAGRKDRT